MPTVSCRFIMPATLSLVPTPSVQLTSTGARYVGTAGFSSGPNRREKLSEPLLGELRRRLAHQLREGGGRLAFGQQEQLGAVLDRAGSLGVLAFLVVQDQHGLDRHERKDRRGPDLSLRVPDADAIRLVH